MRQRAISLDDWVEQSPELGVARCCHPILSSWDLRRLCSGWNGGTESVVGFGIALQGCRMVSSQEQSRRCLAPSCQDDSVRGPLERPVKERGGRHRTPSAGRVLRWTTFRRLIWYLHHASRAIQRYRVPSTIESSDTSDTLSVSTPLSNPLPKDGFIWFRCQQRSKTFCAGQALGNLLSTCFLVILVTNRHTRRLYASVKPLANHGRQLEVSRTGEMSNAAVEDPSSFEHRESIVVTPTSEALLECSSRILRCQRLQVR
jgi:hypothetical protein